MCIQFWLKVNIENAIVNIEKDKVKTYVHWLLCEKYHFSQSVQENDTYKILWDFNIQTNKAIEHRQPDIVCINK